MRTILATAFAAFVLADVAFGLAAIYHLTRYTLPGWMGAKVAVPVYIGLTLLFLGLALYSFLRIP